MMPAQPPGDIGQRLVPNLLDEIATTDPERVIYSICRTKEPSDGFQDITAVQVARAVNRCAWHLHETLGRGNEFPTLAFFGPQDPMYFILSLAAVKVGYKLMLLSPRNSLVANLSLLETTDCGTFLLPPQFSPPFVNDILGSRAMKVVEIPYLQHWIADGPSKPYPYEKTFSQARLEPFVVLHTSGSTSMPKPVIQTHGTWTPLDAVQTLQDQGLPSTFPAFCTGKRVYVAFPSFHCSGLVVNMGAIYNQFTLVFGPFPPTPDIVDAIHRHGNIQESCLPPLTIMELSKTPKYIENLGLVERVIYGGGSLPIDVGNLITKKTKLFNCLGTTEGGVLPSLPCDDWSCFRFSPALGSEFRPYLGDLYEHVVVRRPELDLYQAIFCTYPELQEWRTKDLYVRSSPESDEWLYKGRIDDMIVFSTGEKLNPIDIEGLIGAHPKVAVALVAGHGRHQNSLLVELAKPPASTAEKEAILSEIWPLIEKANESSSTYARIHRHMIAFTTVAKPMLRAGKGTVQRKPTMDLYADEIAALYEKAETPIYRL